MAWVAQVALSNAAVAFPLAGLAWLLSRYCRRPAVTHTLWVLVLVKLVTPPVVWLPLPVQLQSPPEQLAVLPSPATAPFHAATPFPMANPAPALPAGPAETIATLPTSPDPGVASALVGASTAIQWPVLPLIAVPAAITDTVNNDWTAVVWWSLLCVWGLGTVCFFVRDGQRLLRFRKLVSLLGNDDEGTAECQRVARKLGLRTAPQIVLLDAVCTPMLWGIGPWLRIVFPRQLWDSLPATSRETLLAHELAHYARGDHYVRLLELFTRNLFWWHPVVNWAQRELEAAEEECADSWVVETHSDQPRTYAEALLSALDFIAEGKAVVAPVSTGVTPLPFLEYRLKQIMRRSGQRSHSGIGLLSIGMVTVLMLPLHPFVDVLPPQVQASLSIVDAVSFPPPKLDVGTPVALVHSFTSDRDIASSLPELPVTEPAAEQGGWWTEKLDSQWGIVSSPDRQYRLHAESGHRVRLENRTARVSHDLSQAQITCAAFFPSSDKFVTGARDGSVRIWDAATGQPTSFLTMLEAEITSLAIDAQARRAVVTAQNGSVVVLELSSGSQLEEWTADEPVTAARFTPSGARIALVLGSWLSENGNRLVLLDASSLETISSVTLPKPVATLVARGESEVLVAGYDGFVISCDLLTEASQLVGTVSRAVIPSAAFSQNYDLRQQMTALAEPTQPASPQLPPLQLLRLEQNTL